MRKWNLCCLHTHRRGSFARYTVFMVPLLNPDGVARGHWRHNTGQVYLNRDWGTFTQLETRNVARLLDEMDKAGMQLRLMLDFHASQQMGFKAAVGF